MTNTPPEFKVVVSDADGRKGVLAGQMLIDLARSLTPAELELVSESSRAMVETAREFEETRRLAEFFNVLRMLADTLLSEHPAALNSRDLADLDQLGDTPEPSGDDV